VAALTDRVRAAVRKGAAARALELLLEGWAIAPSEPVADAIDVIDARLAISPFTGHARAWLAAAKHVTPVTRGALIRAIPGRSAADTLALVKRAASWRDPRLTHVFSQLLGALPWSGARSRGVWRQLFAVIAAHGDARLLGLTHEPLGGPSVGHAMQGWLTDQLVAATVGLVESAPDPELAAAISVLRATAPPPPAPTERDLLAAIHADPDDDAPRAVYADYLADRGDPRGELIALQLAGRDPDRQRALLHEHHVDWLGPLAAIVREVAFRRGFPASARVSFRHRRDVDQLGALPAWATFEELELDAVRASDARAARFVGPAMRHVRVLRHPDVDRLIASDTPWHRLHTLVVHASEISAARVGELARTPIAPALEHIIVRGWFSAEWLLRITACPPHLTMDVALDDRELGRLLAAARGTALESLTLCELGRRHTFTRDRAGTFTRLDVIVESSDAVAALVAAVRQLPARMLTHVAARRADGEPVPVAYWIDPSTTR